MRFGMYRRKVKFGFILLKAHLFETKLDAERFTQESCFPEDERGQYGTHVSISKK
jgi:hypothetical protein